MPIVKMPDGKKVRFPDDMPKEQIKALILQKYPDAGGKQLTPSQPEAFHGIEGMDKAAIAEAKKAASSQTKMLDNGFLASGQGINSGMLFNFDDEIGAGLTAPFRAVGDAIQGKGFDLGRAYNFDLAVNREVQDQMRDKHGGAMLAGEIAGGLASAAKAGGQLATAKSLGGRALQGGVIAGGQGAAHGFGAGETTEERLGKAALGGGAGALIGGAAPFVGDKVANVVRSRAQDKIINKAIKNAPSAEQLKSAASAMFDQADNANIGINNQAAQRLWSNIEAKVSRIRPNADLDQEAIGALRMIKETIDDTLRPGSNVVPDLKDLHIMRQAAAAAASSNKGRSSFIGSMIVDEIDNFVKTLKPADIAGGLDPTKASNALLKGMSTWSKAKKTAIIEDAIERASSQASGFENGLRTQFRRILNNQKLSRGFTQAERDAMKRVIDGTAGANALKILGKFGFDRNNGLMPALGAGGALMTGNPVLAGLMVGGGALARKGSEVLTQKAANRAMQTVATGGIQSLPAIDAAKPKLIEMLMRGAAPAVGQ